MLLIVTFPNIHRFIYFCFTRRLSNRPILVWLLIVQQICVKYHKNCGFDGKSTKIGADHAEYT